MAYISYMRHSMAMSMSYSMHSFLGYLLSCSG